MSLKYRDRCQETTSSTGTTALLLAGAVSGYQQFQGTGNYVDGDLVPYCAAVGTQWETGIGTYVAASNSITRPATVEENSAGTTANINFSTSPVVYCNASAALENALISTTTTGLLLQSNANAYPTWNAAITVDAFGMHIGGGTTPANSNLSIVSAAGRTGAGTVAVSGTAVTGTGTAFTKDFQKGSSITVTTTSGSETKYITSVTSDTAIVTAAFAGTAAAGTAYTVTNAVTGLQAYPNGLVLLGNGAPPTQNLTGQFTVAGNFTDGWEATGIGISSLVTYAATQAATTSQVYGYWSTLTIGATNTQNLTGSTGACVYQARGNIASGATGTVSGMNGFLCSGMGNAASGATLTTLAYFRTLAGTFTGTVTNQIGLVIQSLSGATNNTGVLLGGVTVSGNWGINDATGYNWTMGGSLTGGSFIPTVSTVVRGLYAPSSNAIALGSGSTATVAITISSAQAVQFNGISTTASAANAFLDGANSNNLLRSTSSIRYKDDLRPISLAQAWNVVGMLEPFSYLSKAANDNKSMRYVGAGAEHVAKFAPNLVNFRDGKPDGLMYDRFALFHNVIIKDHETRIRDLEAENAMLKRAV